MSCVIWAEVTHDNQRAEEDVALREQGSPLLRPKINGMAVEPSKPSAEPEKHQERGVLESLGVGKYRNVIIDIPGKRRSTRREALGDPKARHRDKGVSGCYPEASGASLPMLGMTKSIDYLCREELPHPPI